MHSVQIFPNWDANPILHGALIGVNLLLLISLIIRFEWPLIRRKFGLSDDDGNRRNNKRQNQLNRTNGLYPKSMGLNKSNLSLNHTSVQTVSHTQSPHSVRHTSGNDEIDGNPTKRRVMFRESAQNTLGIQVSTNPSTPSATPTPIPTTHNDQQSQPQPQIKQKSSSDIELTVARSDKKAPSDINEEKYMISYPNEPTQNLARMKMEMFNKVMAEDALSNLNKVSVNAFKNQCISTKRRRASIEFYKQLFNTNNFDNNGKLLTARKRKQRRNKLNRTRRRHSQRNDSMNLKEHQRSFRLYSDDDFDDIDNVNNGNDASLFEEPPQINHAYNNNDYMYRDNHTTNDTMVANMSSTNLNLGHILQSKIYDDDSKQSVRYRYRYILYFPMLIYIIFGLVCLILNILRSEGEQDLYIYIMYGYPALEIILSVVLWCEIDIVILSCGGAHIVEECLEVQISANGHEYKCIYCCWCDCAVLRWCNSCTHDNGFSLFKCHHKFMKILLCVICPLLTCVYYIISEIGPVYEFLIETKIGSEHYDDGHHDHDHEPTFFKLINDAPVYWLIFIIISILYIIFIFTATYIGILIVKSLHFVSSLTPQTLTKQYITCIVVTFLMQTQFVILLLYYNLAYSHEGHHESHIKDGLCVSTPFYMILIYTEFIIISIFNHFAFKNDDFIKFGREAIKKNEVQLFDFKPDFNAIHDLHNYRRVYGQNFLWEIDHKHQPFSLSDDDDADSQHKPHLDMDIDVNLQPMKPNHDAHDNGHHHHHHHGDHQTNKSNKKRKKKARDSKRITTPLITNRGVITVEDTRRPSTVKHRRKSLKKSKKSNRHLTKKKSKANVDKKDTKQKDSTPQKQKEEQEQPQIALESVFDDEMDGGKKITSRPASTKEVEQIEDNHIIDNKVILNPISSIEPTTVITKINEIRDQPLPKEKPLMNNHYQTNSLSLSYQNATFTQTTMKETGHHHPTTTTSLSIDLNVAEIGPYSLDNGNEHETSSTYNSWNENSNDDDISSPNNSPNKSKKKKTKSNTVKLSNKQKSKRDKNSKSKHKASKTSNSSSSSSNSSNPSESKTNHKSTTNDSLIPTPKVRRVDSEIP